MAPAGSRYCFCGFEYRHLDLTPDASGIPFSPPKGTGLPLPVPTSYTYYTPFAKGDQNIARVFASDRLDVNDLLVINTRTSFSNRIVDILRNAGGSVTQIGNEYSLTNRQLREQNDDINDFIYQLEPTWHFLTGNVKHVLVTGVEARSVDVELERQTANLPNIANIFAPVVPEQSLGQLTFLCAAGNSCYNDHLWAHYYGVYAIDQMDLTDAWKVRADRPAELVHDCGRGEHIFAHKSRQRLSLPIYTHRVPVRGLVFRLREPTRRSLGGWHRFITCVKICRYLAATPIASIPFSIPKSRNRWPRRRSTAQCMKLASLSVAIDSSPWRRLSFRARARTYSR